MRRLDRVRIKRCDFVQVNIDLWQLLLFDQLLNLLLMTVARRSISAKGQASIKRLVLATYFKCILRIFTAAFDVCHITKPALAFFDVVKCCTKRSLADYWLLCLVSLIVSDTIA